MYILATCRKIVSVFLGCSYRPELYYMRGAGPKWFERHGGSLESGFDSREARPIRRTSSMTDAAYARAESMLMNMWTDVFGSVGKRTTGTSSGNFLVESRQVRQHRKAECAITELF